MKIAGLVLCFMFIASFAFGMDLYIRVDKDKIIDVSSDEVNLSKTKEDIGTVHEIEVSQIPIYGDHYKEEKVIYDSAKREEMLLEKQNKLNLIASGKAKLKTMGLTNEEISALFNL